MREMNRAWTLGHSCPRAAVRGPCETPQGCACVIHSWVPYRVLYPREPYPAPKVKRRLSEGPGVCGAHVPADLELLLVTAFRGLWPGSPGLCAPSLLTAPGGNSVQQGGTDGNPTDSTTSSATRDPATSVLAPGAHRPPQTTEEEKSSELAGLSQSQR